MKTKSKVRVLWVVALVCMLAFFAHSQTNRNSKIKVQEYDEPTGPGQSPYNNPRYVPDRDQRPYNNSQQPYNNPRYVPGNHPNTTSNPRSVPNKSRATDNSPQGFTSMNTEYFKNGKPKARGLYAGGKKNGTWIYYNKSGVPEKVIFYSYDSVVYDDLAARDFYLATYTFDDDNLDIFLPIDWRKWGTRDFVYIGACKKLSNSERYAPSITITRGEVYTSVQGFEIETLGNIVQAFNDFRINGTQSTVVNRLRRDQYFCTCNYHTLNIGMVITFIPKDRDVYVVSSIALNEPDGSYLKYRDLFVEIANSLSVQ